MMGFLISRMRSNSSMYSRLSMSTGVASAISLMSAPAAKARSLPVITIAPMFGSASKACRAATSSPMSVRLRAFSALGRLRRISPTLPRTSVRMVV